MHRDILLMLLTRARARRNCRSVVAMHKVVLMMLLAVVSSSAMAEWIKIGSTSMADQTVTYYADPATIRKSGNMVKMWNLSDFKSAKDAGNGNIYMSTKAQYEFDCKEEQTRLLYLISHSQNMGRGEPVSMGRSSSGWEPVAPASRQNLLWIFACIE